MRVRVFDDGFGFRYEVPQQPGYDAVNITDELTEFRLDETQTQQDHGVVDSGPSLESLRVPLQHARRSTPCTWRTRR